MPAMHSEDRGIDRILAARTWSCADWSGQVAPVKLSSPDPVSMQPDSRACSRTRINLRCINSATLCITQAGLSCALLACL